MLQLQLTMDEFVPKPQTLASFEEHFKYEYFDVEFPSSHLGE
jgi:hypothetical protein